MRHFDLIVIGTGSGNSVIGPQFDHLSIAVVEKGLFGGTCLNAGCIPTKMYVYPADLAHGAEVAGPLGVDAQVDKVHWSQMRERIFGRIDSIEAGGREYRSGQRTPNTTVFAGTARFTGAKSLSITDASGDVQEIAGDRIVIAAGGRPVVPQIPGLVGEDAVEFHTSDSIMRIDELPASIIIIGGGYIAAEFAHVFASFGTKVTQIIRGDIMLRHHDHDISARFTELASERYELLTGCEVVKVAGTSTGIRVDLDDPAGPRSVEAEVLLVAAGRTPNSDILDAAAAGYELHPDGRLVVDEFQRTNVDGVFALGDISSDYALKHVANHESRVVQHNLEYPDRLIAADHRFVPAAVFTHPQIASVGLTETQATDRGVKYVVAKQEYGGIAAGWAREDTTGFLKLLAAPDTGLLIGAHIIGPEAATVIQPLIQAMSFGQSARNLARGQYWIHPALTELLENALLALPLDPA